MRKRKHAVVQKRGKRTRFSGGQRRKSFMNIALGLVVLMALSLIVTSYSNKSSAPKPVAQQSSSQPESEKTGSSQN